MLNYAKTWRNRVVKKEEDTLDKPYKKRVSAQKMPSRLEKEKAMPDELVMALNKAKALSSRNGVAWLMFEKNQLIASYSGFAGDPMFASLERLEPATHKRHLYISSPPHRHSYKSSELEETAEKWELDVVCFPQLSNAMNKALVVEAHESKNYTLHTPALSPKNESIFFGPAMLENHQRPWTTCFISMNSQGRGVKYDHFLSGFGAESTFHHALTKHTIVAIQKSLTQSDPQLHAIKEKCYAIDIENADALAQLQSKLARGGQSSLVTLCDYAFFCALADANTVDECRTYMALTELPNFQPSPISMGEHTNTVPSLLGWKVTSTHIFDAGVLIQIRRANQYNQTT
ncbi:hypothetical protein A1OW_01455 [Enterovibrio norvegicus]|uniref:hypothetical protein n=1 Tax=Enterovibrio norvegicus TaxID=188144 RepID=UPI00030F0693|nr:hypothetical protein [Enterovibrio norvegicus]OEF49765.1 hypothetical protein A1OW_01455 [Enterovibrio norvegicus]